jgi:hypothetical protein
MPKKILLLGTLFLLSLSLVKAETTMTTLDNAVTRAYTKKMTASFSTENFKPYQAIRRDEAAKFFVLFAKLVGKTENVVATDQCQFSDLNEAWADLKNVVVESCRLGIFKGSNGKFTPQGMLTNAQAVAVLMRIVDGYQEEVGNDWADNYYTRAKALNLLNEALEYKNEMAERGDVITLLYNARTLKGVNEKPPVDTSVFNQTLITKTPGVAERTYPYAQSYSGGYLGITIQS